MPPVAMTGSRTMASEAADAAAEEEDGASWEEWGVEGRVGVEGGGEWKGRLL